MLWREELERGAAGHDAPAEDRAAVEARAGVGAAGYGELPAEEAGRLFRWLKLGPDDVFADLGSGTGKLVLQAALETEVGGALGVELSRFRHEAALERWERVGRPAGVELRCEDFRRSDLSEVTVLFAGATVFPEELVTELGELAARWAREGRLARVLSTRELVAERLRERGRLKVETSWGVPTAVILYERVA